ncbi:MAG: leucine-rich repeat domain-containing protein, partial [Firmicutes bacterium]|nr:leucine-rich repeat domain-containing protein [Bacillota bacterium]
KLLFLILGKALGGGGSLYDLIGYAGYTMVDDIATKIQSLSTLSGLKSMLDSSMKDYSDLIDFLDLAIVDTVNMSDEEFDSYLQTNSSQIALVEKIVGYDISTTTDLSMARTFISSNAMNNAYGLSKVLANAGLLMLDSNFHPIKAITHGHTQETYVTWINSMYYGYEGWKGNDSINRVEISNKFNYGNYCFAECRNLKSVVISEEYCFLGVYAFMSCSSLKSLTIAVDHQDEKERYWFSGCNSLSEITYTKGKTGIMPDVSFNSGNDAYYSNRLEAATQTLKKISFEEGVIRIGNYAFGVAEYSTNLAKPGCIEEINLPSTLESIGGCAFAYQQSLTKLTIPDGVTEFGYGIFRHCTGITSTQDIILPSTIRKIPDGLYSYCTNLVEVIIPDTVTEIGYSAYEGTNIAELIIPETVEKIGDNAIGYCNSLKKVTIPVDYGYPNGVSPFRACRVEEIVYTVGKTGVMPDRSKSNSNDNYYENTLEYGARSTLKTVTYDEGIIRIGDYAYYANTALTDVLFAKSVDSIGTNCFQSLTKDNVKFYGYKDSYAETYANDLGVDFVPLFYPIIITDANEFLTGEEYIFEARTYSGIDLFMTDVSWSIEGQSSDKTTIDEKGLLEIAADESADSVTVIADNGTNKSTFEAKIKQHTHEYSSEPTFRWTEDYTACNAVVKCQTCNAEKSYTCAVTKSSEPPSCSKEGKITYTANVTISDKEYTDMREISQEKVEHTVVNIEGNDPTCTEEGLTEGSYCSECGEVIKEQMTVDALGHVLVKVDAAEPTEELTGNIEYYICNRCGKYFSDPDGEKEIPPTSVIIVPVNHVHELSYIEEVESTCTVNGHRDYYLCSKCGKIYSDQDGIEEIYYTELPLAAHSLMKTERVDPTETKDGCEEYYT